MGSVGRSATASEGCPGNAGPNPAHSLPAGYRLPFRLQKIGWGHTDFLEFDGDFLAVSDCIYSYTRIITTYSPTLSLD